MKNKEVLILANNYFWLRLKDVAAEILFLMNFGNIIFCSIFEALLCRKSIEKEDFTRCHFTILFIEPVAQKSQCNVNFIYKKIRARTQMSTIPMDRFDISGESWKKIEKSLHIFCKDNKKSIHNALSAFHILR